MEVRALVELRLLNPAFIKQTSWSPLCHVMSRVQRQRVSGKPNSRTLLRQSRELVPCQLLQYKTSSYLHFQHPRVPRAGIAEWLYRCGRGRVSLPWSPVGFLEAASPSLLAAELEEPAWAALPGTGEGSALSRRQNTWLWGRQGFPREPPKEEVRLNAAVSAVLEECLSRARCSGRALLDLVSQVQHACSSSALACGYMMGYKPGSWHTAI